MFWADEGSAQTARNCLKQSRLFSFSFSFRSVVLCAQGRLLTLSESVVCNIDGADRSSAADDRSAAA